MAEILAGLGSRERTRRRAIVGALTIERLWIVSALALFAIRTLLIPIPPADFWWHMAAGRETVTTGTIPMVDTQSYTQAGEPYYNQAWLAQVLLYALYVAVGIAGIVVVQAGVITLTYAIVLWLAIRRSGSVRPAVFALIAAFLISANNWSVRPQSYAFPLFAALLGVVTAHRLGWGNYLWAAPPLMLVWVNLHGSFPVGLALIGLTALGEAVTWLTLRRRGAPAEAGEAARRARELALWGALAALMITLNPIGLDLFENLRNATGRAQIVLGGEEWQPPTVRNVPGALFFLHALGTGLLLIYARRRPDPADLLTYGAFLWLALSGQRYIVWYAMVATPFVAAQAATLLPAQVALPRRSAWPLANWLLAALVAGAVVACLPPLKGAWLPPTSGALVEPDTGVAAVEVLARDPDPPRHLFAAMGYGSYITWALPRQQLMIDARLDHFQLDHWLDYDSLGRGQNVEALLAKYDIDGLLLSRRTQAPLIRYIETHGGSRWQRRYEDAQTVYFRRVEPASRRPPDRTRPAGAAPDLEAGGRARLSV